MSSANNGATAKKTKRVFQGIGSAVRKSFNVKTIWRKPGLKKILIIYLAVLFIFSGLAVWKAVSEPARINFPELTYREITSRAVRGEIGYWGLQNTKVSNGGLTAPIPIVSSEIFVRTNDRQIFKTEVIEFQILTLTQLLKRVNAEEISDIIYNPSAMSGFGPPAAFFEPSLAIGQYKNGKFFIIHQATADFFSDDEVKKNLRAQGVEVYPTPYQTFNDSNSGRRWGWTVVASIFWLLFPLVIFFLNANYQMQAERAEIREDFEKPTVRFSDVAGIDEAKADILKVVDFIKHPEAYEALGAQLPAGILLEGAPGVGKTLLAKAIAGECELPLITSDQSGFMETYVGTGPKEVRRLFARGRQTADTLKKRVIVFIDEMDAVGTRSGGEGHGGDDEKNRTITQLTQEIDGLHSDKRLIVLATTNRPENIDPALLRPGRLSLRIVVPTPSFKGRVDILKVHVKGKPLAAGVDLEKIAHLAPTGTSGADLMNIVNTAAFEAGSKRKKVIEMDDFERAVNKIMMGEERKSLILNQEEKWIFSVHEAGHAMEAIILKKFGFNIPLPNKISIIPTTKGMGGYTQFIEKEERLLLTKKQCQGLITTLYGGRLAEQIMTGEISSGAKNDYDRASAIAEQMATSLAMESDELGQRVFTIEAGSGYLGQANRLKTLSPEKLAQIDRVIDERLAESFKKAKEIITDYREDLEKLAEKIRDNETIEITPEMIDSIKLKDAKEAAS